ncbi:MAG: 2Fe-2S iron-sulfur cluster binding domain-containing protein [SAR202 cluster bacterium]|nr:2Fe-2S iron-sulfur cluster binding domain-containing protein [SAR202 cluster bacterium]
MPDPITFTIDGQEVAAKPGQTVLQAAIDAGVYIPYLCYFPTMKPYGACRVCVVEVETPSPQGPRKATLASCTAPVSKDMVVNTQPKHIAELRKGILDLLMTEHPHGCLTCHRIELCGSQDICLRHVRVNDRCVACPKNERCELKDTVRSAQLEMETPLQYHNRNLPIHVDDPFYDRDYNLCIVCARCVRVCEEVRVDSALSLISRSGRTIVGTSHGSSLLESGCEFCGACIDVCPTGALVERDYKWDKAVKSVNTVCPNCPVGCQVFMDVNKRNKVIRVRGDFAGAANMGMACFKGKFATDYPNHPGRVRYPMVRVEGQLQRTTWEQALERITVGLLKYKPAQVGVISSPRGTNEDHYVAQKLARVALKTNNVDSALNVVPELTESLQNVLGHPAATNSIWELEKSKAILVVSGNPTEEQNVLAVPIKKATRAGASLIVIDPRETELTRYAAHWLRPRPGTEVALLGAILRVVFEESLEDKNPGVNNAGGIGDLKQKLWDFDLVRISSVTGVPADAIRAAARAYGAVRPAAIVYGADTIGRADRANLVQAAANLAMATGNLGVRGGGLFPLYHGANTQGALDVGCTPSLLPGHRRIDRAEDRKRIAESWGVEVPSETGLGTNVMFEAMAGGQIKAAIVMADGIPPKSDLLGDVQAAVGNLEFLVVSDYVMSEIASQADVLLPAATYTEISGTYTNLERRVQLLRPGMALTGEERPGWQALAAIGQATGSAGFEFESSSSVLAELTGLVDVYKGITPERLADRSLQWPVWASDHAGTPVLYNEANESKPQFRAVTMTAMDAQPDREFPLLLAHGRVLQDPTRDVRITKADELNQLSRDEIVELHPEDARALGIAAGDLVDVRSRPRADGGSDLFTGIARLTSPHRGMIAITTLFASVASDVEHSQHPDPAPRVRGLPLRQVVVTKAPVAATAAD